MPRPNLSDEKRRELLPLVARAFADLGYRRTTTAELAERCKVQENILYRLWPNKKSMFIAAIEYVYDLAQETWERLIAKTGSSSTAEQLLEYEAKHIGEFRHARIVFAGLSETDDPDIRRAMANMYRRYQQFVLRQIESHRAGRNGTASNDSTLYAWAVIGLGTVASIARELKLLDDSGRSQLMNQVGKVLIDP